MKFGIGQVVILLTTEGKPASGRAVIIDYDKNINSYTVNYHPNDKNSEILEHMSEERIIPYTTS